MVRNAYEQEATDAGLFGDERIRNFFAMVKSMANDCFQSLYDTVMREYANTTEENKAERFERGLAFIANDSNYRLAADEVSRAAREFPTIQHEYERAMVKFAQIMVPHKDPHLKIEVPSFSTFLLRLYSRIAAHRVVKSMRYYQMTYFEQDIFMKDMMRINMNACLNMRTVVSEKEALSQPQGETSSILRAALASTRTSSSMSGSSGGSSQQVLPSDSVSNISAGRPTPPPPKRSSSSSRQKQSTPPSVLSALSEYSDERSEVQQSDFSLRKYKHQLQHNKKDRTDVAVKPFRPASIVKTKEVDLQPPGDTNDALFEPDEPQPATGNPSDIAGYSTLSG
jgi:hypothetical protein